MRNNCDVDTFAQIHDAAQPDALEYAASEEVTYLYDEREISFYLWEYQKLEERFLGIAPAQHATRASLEALLAKAKLHAAALAAANRDGDRNPAHLTAQGIVEIPDSFKELWPEHRDEWFWMRQQSDDIEILDETVRYPHPAMQVISELFVGANPSFMTYAGFSPSAANLIRVRGTDLQQSLFVDKLRSIEWDACFCATEPEAGSDLTIINTTADQIDGEHYAISGTKRYITAGMHELTDNTIYLVLGRIRGTKQTSLSLSCFIVPRYWIEADGSLSDNNVRCAAVEEKMGLNGCANTLLKFGEGGRTRGFLLGNKPNLALFQLANMMRKARIGTGHMAVALASSAYLHSVNYARARVQGARFDQAATPGAPRVSIMTHNDVQRMLLDMRSRVEGCRYLLGEITQHSARLQQAICAVPIDEALARRHARLAMLYAPVAKAYCSEQAWNIVATAIQVHGAVGYLRSSPLEQYARDLKILTIWEGTNFIQAQDLVRDKLRFGQDSVGLREFADDVGITIALANEEPTLRGEAGKLQQALAALIDGIAAVRRLAEASELLRISQFCTRVLESFGDVMVGRCLLEAALIATDKLATGNVDIADRAFYTGKVKTARYFLRNCLNASIVRLEPITDPDAFIELDDDEHGSAQVQTAASRG